MTSSFRFAVLGCGRIAPKHADSLKKIDGVSLVACADRLPDRAKSYAEKNAIKAFDSLEELLSWGQFDVLSVCTPSGMHADHAVAAMNAGKHVVVEKPMALLLEDADRMIEASIRNQVRLFVVKQNRYNLPVLALRQALDEGRFGKLVLGTTRVRWCRDQKYYDQDEWRGTWAQDGGVFANQASHHIDLLEWCMGDVESVLAKTATHLVDIECEDTGLVILKFVSGALGLIEATTATRPKDLEGSLSILGERGSVEIAGFAVNEIRHFNFVDVRPEDVEVKNKFSSNPPSVYGFGHHNYYQNVV
ncbi:MAG TPA: Gfo/Idh/MocA family oxidoreductase, partial [Oligoflexia bacterium]|nr:Gfo/Idh/MocA family oxidoreductase [Oligoflexia bacterium]